MQCVIKSAGAFGRFTTSDACSSRAGDRKRACSGSQRLFYSLNFHMTGNIFRRTLMTGKATPEVNLMCEVGEGVVYLLIAHTTIQ